MKKLIILLLLIPAVSFAQKEYKKTIDLQNADHVFMEFKWPDQVTIKYHEKKEILIEGSVSVNYGEYDDAFIISTEREGKDLRIISKIQGMDTMQQITVVKEKDGHKRYYRGEDGDYTIISGGGSENVSTGVVMDIFLTVYLPKNVPAKVEAKFGLIEVKEVTGPLIVNSKFGGVDVTIDERGRFDLKAATAFGEIFTDLSVDFRGNGNLKKNGNWHRLSTTFSGGGAMVDVESKFGNVYLRKK